MPDWLDQAPRRASSVDFQLCWFHCRYRGLQGDGTRHGQIKYITPLSQYKKWSKGFDFAHGLDQNRVFAFARFSDIVQQLPRTSLLRCFGGTNSTRRTKSGYSHGHVGIPYSHGHVGISGHEAAAGTGAVTLTHRKPSATIRYK
eukprot:2982685-Rhodomonas_salina.2